MVNRVSSLLIGCWQSQYELTWKYGSYCSASFPSTNRINGSMSSFKRQRSAAIRLQDRQQS